MKFKVIFIVFNVIIVLSFLFIFFMPYFLLGWEYTRVFWAGNWPLAAVFVAIIVGLNAYFVSNWKLFGLLEAEDWKGLTAYLERLVFARKKIRSQFVRILINTYVVLSVPEKITELEQFLRSERPKMVPAFAVQFGIPRLLRNDPEEMQEYYGEMKKKRGCADVEWISWTYAFALMLQKKSDEAQEHLLSLCGSTRNPVLSVITLYLLDSFANRDENVKSVVDSGRGRIKKKYSHDTFSREIEKNKTNIQVLVLSRLIKDATDWVFEEEKVA